MRLKIAIVIAVTCLMKATLALAGDWVTNNATLNLLRADFTNRVYTVGTNQIEVSLEWLSRIYGNTCQRPPALYLMSNQVEVFMTPKSWAFTTHREGPYDDLLTLLKIDVASYLAKAKIVETNIVVNYVGKTTQNKAPEDTSLRADPQR